MTPNLIALTIIVFAMAISGCLAVLTALASLN